MKPLTHPLLHTAASFFVCGKNAWDILPQSSSSAQSSSTSYRQPFGHSVFRMCPSYTPVIGSPLVPTSFLLLQSLAATTLPLLSWAQYIWSHIQPRSCVLPAFGLFYLAQCPPHSNIPSYMEYHLRFQGCIIFLRLFSHIVIYSYIATQAPTTATVNSPAMNTGCRDPIPNFIFLKFSGSQSNFF